MKHSFLVVNGILTNPQDIDGWTDLFEDFYQNMGYPCTKYEYFSGALTRFIRQGKRVKDLQKICSRITSPLVFVGHSNGCELFTQLVHKSNLYFEAAHLFASAMDGDFNKNGLNKAVLSGRVKKIYLYCSAKDRILRDFASKTSFMSFLGLGYGTCGYTGPSKISKAIEDKVFVTWENEFDHSDWFTKKNIDISFAYTLRK